MKKLMILTTLLLMVLSAFAADSQREHTVERGETIVSIAQHYNITVDALLKANPMAKDLFYTGMVLVIPNAAASPAAPPAAPGTVPAPQIYKENKPENNNSGRITGATQTTYIPNTYHFGSDYDKAIEFGVGIQANAGASSFSWSGGSVNGTLAYGGDLYLDMLFNETTLFIPSNWLMELDLGYIKKGAATFDMAYAQAQLYPLGYRIPISSYGLSIKGGVEVGYPLGDFDGRWNADLQVGACLGLRFELGRLGIGCNMSYDFTEVSSECGQSLKNIAVLGTISFKFAKF